jgi:hypothetical protein
MLGYARLGLGLVKLSYISARLGLGWDQLGYGG